MKPKNKLKIYNCPSCGKKIYYRRKENKNKLDLRCYDCIGKGK